MKLSIIIPYYKTYKETKELLDVLIPQLRDDIEVLIIDDGCHEKRLDELIKGHDNIRIWHLSKNSGTASKPRNIGLDNAKGEYITFIDSDDMISHDYIKAITHRLKADIIFISWRNERKTITMYLKPPKWNCSVWCRVYKRKIIGDIRFDENLRIAEDWKFNEQIKYNTSYCITKTLYYYNMREGSILRS